MLRVKKYSDKIWIWRVEKGFAFLGYHFACTIAGSSIVTSCHRRLQLYRYFHNVPIASVLSDLAEWVLSPTGKAPPYHGARQLQSFASCSTVD